MISNRTLFWLLIGLQAAGSQVILWFGLPLYHRLLAGGRGSATDLQLGMATLAVVMMQSGHWISMRLQPRLRFPRRVILGHVLFCVGELSLFFINALAVVVAFDRFNEVQFNVWKFALLAGILFSVCSYKYQVGSLGEQLIKGESDNGETAHERRPAA